jgi:hypothetical protein
MGSLLFRTAAMSIFLFFTTSIKAQITITEYFIMKRNFSLDLNNSAVVKTLYIKGVLDIQWDISRRELAVTYNPKLVTIAEAVRHILNKTYSSVPLKLNGGKLPPNLDTLPRND